MALTLILPVVIGEAHTDTGQQFLRAAVAVGLASTVGLAVHLVVRALRQATAKSRSILQTSQEAFIDIDEHGLIREWNPQAEGLFGGAGTRSSDAPSSRRSSRGGTGTPTWAGNGALPGRAATCR